MLKLFRRIAKALTDEIQGSFLQKCVHWWERGQQQRGHLLRGDGRGPGEFSLGYLVLLRSAMKQVLAFKAFF